MSDATPTRQPSDALALRPYAPPSLTPLGTVEAVTAGPVEDGGNIDQLVGATGGFRTADTTS